MISDLYKEIIAFGKQMYNEPNLIKYVNVYNSNVERFRSDESKHHAVRFPAMFIEIEGIDDVKSFGNGFSNENLQIYENLIIRLHILTLKSNDINGGFDANLEALELGERINRKFHRAKFKGTSTLMREGSSQDFDHDRIYKLELEYKCSFTVGYEPILSKPIDTIIITPEI